MTLVEPDFKNRIQKDLQNMVVLASDVNISGLIRLQSTNCLREEGTINNNPDGFVWFGSQIDDRVSVDKRASLWHLTLIYDMLHDCWPNERRNSRSLTPIQIELWYKAQNFLNWCQQDERFNL